MTWTESLREPKTSLPPRLRAGDALTWSVQTCLPVGAVVFFTLTGVINNTPTRLNIGGNGAATTVDEVTTYAGVAVDSTGVAAFTLASTTTAAWLAGRYEWVLFSIDASGNRDELAQGVLRVDPDVNGTNPVDPRTYAERVLAQIRCAIEGSASDDVIMYKIGGREVTKMPRTALLEQEAIFAARVRRERIRRGEKVRTSSIGISFGGRGQR